MLAERKPTGDSHHQKISDECRDGGRCHGDDVSSLGNIIERGQEDEQLSQDYKEWRTGWVRVAEDISCGDEFSTIPERESGCHCLEEDDKRNNQAKSAE